MYKITESDKEFILDLHNKYRQEIASGSVDPYQPAVNMKEVVCFFCSFRQMNSNLISKIFTQTWNDELAYVACFNAITCTFAHDKCRNTGTS